MQTDAANAAQVQAARRRVVIARHTCAVYPRPVHANSRSTAMKLTPELIQSVPSHLNPIKERQLDVRGTWRVLFFD